MVAVPVSEVVTVAIVGVGISLSNGSGLSFGLSGHSGKKAKGDNRDGLHGGGCEQARGRSRTPH